MNKAENTLKYQFTKANVTGRLKGRIRTEFSPAGTGSKWRLQSATVLLAMALTLVSVQAKAELSREEAAILPRVAAVVSVDITQADIGNERAILIIDDADEVADLVIMASEPDDAAGQALIVARGLVWSGRMAGQEPTLSVDPDNNLTVHSQQTAIGRTIWEETLTVSEHDGEILVSGYKFASSDRITAREGQCDWNLVSGQWTSRTSQPNSDDLMLAGKLPRTIAITDWSAQSNTLPEFCRFDF